VLVGSKLKEHEWIMNFIEEYKSMLAPESMELTYNYNLARAHFAQGKFEQALNDLNRIKRVSHVQYKIIIKNITMMIYYELSYFDMAHGVIDSYRHFLSNDKSISELRKVRYLNFINFFNRLIRLKEKFNGKDLENLSFDLKQVSNVLEKDWMLEKAEEMKNAF
jgi:tetratricopeptide (TPR) repeat protein